MNYPRFKACAAHVSPVFLNAEATVDKACSLIAEAARNGAKLIAFPEAYIAGFPLWAGVQAPVHNHEFFKRMVAESILANGPEMQRLRDAVREHGIVVSMGFSEASPASAGCIWNSNVLIGEDGAILNHHRKLVPSLRSG